MQELHFLKVNTLWLQSLIFKFNTSTYRIASYLRANYKNKLNAKFDEVLQLFYISVVTCGSPSNIVNGYWSPKYGYCLDYQCTLRFMCNAGFHKTSMGDVSITCGENGTWSHWNEKCEGLFYVYSSIFV